jgi:hypothetical protein
MNPANGSAKPMSIVDFIRSCPQDMAADQVVKLAKKAKVPIKNKRRVWQVRSADKLAAARRAQKNGQIVVEPTVSRREQTTAQPALPDDVFQRDDVERQFLQIIAMIGLTRARQLLQQFSDSVFSKLESKD